MTPTLISFRPLVSNAKRTATKDPAVNQPRRKMLRKGGGALASDGGGHNKENSDANKAGPTRRKVDPAPISTSPYSTPRPRRAIPSRMHTPRPLPRLQPHKGYHEARSPQGKQSQREQHQQQRLQAPPPKGISC